MLTLDPETGRVGSNREERDPVGVPLPTGGPRHHDDAVGGRPVEHLDLLPAQAPAGAVPLGARRHAAQVVAAAPLLVRDREQPLAFEELGQPLALLPLAAAEEQRLAAEQHAGEKRLGRELAAEGLEHDRESGEAHVGAAELLRERDADPTQLGHLPPQLPGEPVGVVRVAECPHTAHGRALRREVGDRLGKKLLIFGEYELHDRLPAPRRRPLQSGRPSTRLAMMLSWISEVPPSMELPRARSQPRVRSISSSSKPGPSQPRP